MTQLLIHAARSIGIAAIHTVAESSSRLIQAAWQATEGIRTQQNVTKRNKLANDQVSSNYPMVPAKMIILCYSYEFHIFTLLSRRS